MIWPSLPFTHRASEKADEFTLPAEYQNRGLIPCSLSKLEKQFAQQFPGIIKTYRHDSGITIFRQVTGATRKLHDSKICLRSSGFHTSNITEQADEIGRTWQHYQAHNRKNSLSVRSIVLKRQSQESWPSVREWFWHAFFSKQNQQYLAITEIADMT